MAPLFYYGLLLRGTMHDPILVVPGVLRGSAAPFGYLAHHLGEHLAQILLPAFGPGTSLPGRLHALLGTAAPLLAAAGLCLRPPRAALAFALAGLAYVLLFFTVFLNHDYGTLYLGEGVSLLGAYALSAAWGRLARGGRVGAAAAAVLALTAADLAHGFRLPAFTAADAAEYAAFERDAREASAWIGAKSYLFWKLDHYGPNPLLLYVGGRPRWAGLAPPESLRPCPDFLLVSKAFLARDPEGGRRARIERSPSCRRGARENAHFLLVNGSCLCPGPGDNGAGAAP
jgi:hypothetical protein